jgi:hypothetical protein
VTLSSSNRAVAAFQVRLRAELGGCQKQSCKTGRTRSTCVSPVIGV